MNEPIDHLAGGKSEADTRVQPVAGKYLDELDAAQAGWPFIMSKVPDCKGGSILYSQDEPFGRMSRIKWCAIFDSNDNLCAAYLLTRDALNRTQLTLVDATKAGA